ncbi:MULTISPECIES: ABC transporter substrate-binding protein [unclassified Achromobacter]|uniref:ABC transporter substrate-binding protein n=1 Tax=unclassified Achromobacter TaxID=2626865 RepID=UPI00069FDE6C|nr:MULTISPECIES: ABC transporter substrate-binding protein [unclassified Achromobacter]KOF52087.1 ABC transporter substrate-binding protein [Achromobacter sp. DMS1]
MKLKSKLRRGARHLLLSVAVAGASLAAPASMAETVTAVMQSGLRVLDPILTTAFMTRDHAYMIYDTLLGLDEHFKVQPQMASWTVGDDGKTYTFALRDGLKWHDGKPVTSEDCIASIRRWAAVDATGQVLMTLVQDMAAVDDRHFRIVLKQPTPLLLEGLSKISSRPAFMMPRRIAETPASQPIGEYIGSGPFRFVASEFRPGLKVVYEKNKDYVPRSEPPSWTAGGKVANVDRVEWVAMPDQMTAINALQNGEVDFIQQVPFDLLPMVENQDGLKVEVLDKLGAWTYFRMNHLYPPFDNRLVRQAAIAAVSQEDVLKALVGDPKYYKTCAAVMGCGNPYGDNYGEDWVVPARLDKARALLKEAGYDGTPVIVLQPTDIAMLSAQPVVVGAALRKAGFNVTMKAMDWQTLVTQQGNQNPPQEGGWNLFSTYSILASSGDPFGNTTLASNGRKAWAGWPDVPAIEALRLKFAQASDPAERKRIAAEIQKLAIDEGVVAPLGQFQIPAAYSTRLSGILQAPVTLFWHLKKAEK